MKQFDKLTFGALFCAALAGCNGIDKDTDLAEQSTPLDVSGTFFTYTTSDNPKDETSTGPESSMGLYMFDDESGQVTAENVRYTSIDGTERFQAAGMELKTPEDGSLVTVLGYAPYNEALENGIYPLDFTRQGTPELMLYRSSMSNVLHGNKVNARLELRPVLSRAVFNLTLGKNVQEADLEGLSISIEGMFTKASFDVLAGSLSAGETPGSITPAKDSDREFSAILLPSGSVDGYSLKLTLPAMEQSERVQSFSDIADFTKIDAGMLYTFDITVEPDQMHIDMTQTPIGDWEEGGSDQNIGDTDIFESLLMTDIQDFEEGNLFATQKYEEIPAETWFYRWYEKINETDNYARIIIDPTIGKKVVNFKMPKDDNVTAADKVIGYHTSNIPKGKFKVQFKANYIATAGASIDMKCYVRCGTKRYVVSNNNGNGTSGAVIRAGQYGTYEIVFDFNTTTANTWDSGNKNHKPATDEDLKDIYFTFAFNHKAAEVNLYDFKLLKAE